MKKNLYEYSFEFVIEYAGVYYLMLVAVALFSLSITSFLMIMSIVKDLRNELANLNVIDVSTENAIEIRKRISGFIQLHMYSKQLSSTVDLL